MTGLDDERCSGGSVSRRLLAARKRPALHRSAATPVSGEPVVVFEDDDLLVVDKPGGLVCHSASQPGQASLVDWVRAHGVATPRLLNRLDRETSGVVVVARNERAAKIVSKQMLRREIEKEYLAICWGQLAADRGVVDQPIGVTTDSVVYTKRVVDPQAGKACQTEFEVLERLSGAGAESWSDCSMNLHQGFTVVRLRPQTGRAHQLRVHLGWLGHPIVGDKVYGPDERLYLEFIEKGVTAEMLQRLLLPRHALHAAAVTVRHPTSQERVTFRAPVPADMARFIEERRESGERRVERVEDGAGTFS